MAKVGDQVRYPIRLIYGIHVPEHSTWTEDRHNEGMFEEVCKHGEYGLFIFYENGTNAYHLVLTRDDDLLNKLVFCDEGPSEVVWEYQQGKDEDSGLVFVPVQIRVRRDWQFK